MSTTRFNPPRCAEGSGSSDSVQSGDRADHLARLPASFCSLLDVQCHRRPRAINDSSTSSTRRSFRTWTRGAVFLVWGIIQTIAAFAVNRGAGRGIAAAVVTAFFNAIAHLSAANTYPVWSITIVVLDGLIMYGHRPLCTPSRIPTQPKNRLGSRGSARRDRKGDSEMRRGRPLPLSRRSGRGGRHGIPTNLNRGWSIRKRSSIRGQDVFLTRGLRASDCVRIPDPAPDVVGTDR